MTTIDAQLSQGFVGNDLCVVPLIYTDGVEGNDLRVVPKKTITFQSHKKCSKKSNIIFWSLIILRIKMDLPKRKLQRFGGYDYSQFGVYFVTLCTQNKLCLFGRYGDDGVFLNDAGKMVDRIFLEVCHFYPAISVEKHIVMPNHLHALLSIQGDRTALESETGNGTTPVNYDGGGTTRRSFPTSISEYIQRFKTYSTRLYIEGVKNGIYPPFDGKIWQKSFHDHIIRDDKDLTTHLDYIENNPIRFMDDEYH